MNTKTVWTIAKKDWMEVRQNTSALVSMIVVPLIFIVVYPLIFLLMAGDPTMASELTGDADLASFFQNMPAGMQAALIGWNEIQSALVLLLGYLFAPLFLIIPLMMASVIAAESFAGERERKTIEALLYTPATDTELFAGKVVAAAIPTLLITWLSFLLYTLVLNIAGMPVMGRIWFPLPSWYPLMFWVSPAITALSIAATVLISAKTKTFMGAYQLSGSLVVLVLGLMVGQIAGVMYLSVGVVWLIGVILWLVAAGLFVLGVRTFQRTTLLING
jgi:ABC-type Na+ efflux pump permease subunit